MPPSLFHWLQLKVLDRIYEATIWGLWKVYNSKLTGEEKKATKSNSYKDEFLLLLSSHTSRHRFKDCLNLETVQQVLTEKVAWKVLSLGPEGWEWGPWERKIFYLSKPYFSNEVAFPWQWELQQQWRWHHGWQLQQQDFCRLLSLATLPWGRSSFRKFIIVHGC